MTSPAPAGAEPTGSLPAGVTRSERDEALLALEGAFEALMTELRRSHIEAAECVSPGMLPGSYKVLTTISRAGASTVSSLAETMAADKGFVSRTVSELEDLGLVTRMPDPHDGRVRLIASTPLGEERLSLARLPYKQRMSAVLEEWPVETVDRLTRLLDALTKGTMPH